MSGHTRLAFSGVLAVALGALSLLPVIDGVSWFWLALLGLSLVAGTGELCRQLRLARLLIPFAQVSVLLFFLTARFAGQEAVLGFLPGGKALEKLSSIAGSGFESINKYAPPVPASTGMVALAACGVCLVGLIVDVLVVTLRRAALAGLPLLALYSVSASVLRGGVHWILFGLAGFGYLGLLLAEGRDRVRQWGRPLHAAADGRPPERQPPHDVETGPLAQLGRRIGATALGLAIVVPALVPDIGHGLIGGGGAGFGRGGSQRIATVNPIATLKQDLNRPENIPVLAVRTNHPKPHEQYLRDATLDEFSGEQWLPSKPHLVDVPKPLPRPDGLNVDVATTLVETRIDVVDRFESPWLLMPHPAVDLDVKGRWRFDPAGHDVIGDRRQTISGLTYRVKSLDISPTRAQLEGDTSVPTSMSRYQALPPGIPPLVKQRALAAVRGTSTQYQKAVKLQNWFLDNFEYSTTVRSGHSSSLIVDFLQKRKGYCEQFAATMAVMARQLGIPARVAVGFTAGQQQADRSWMIRTHDRHAWPELYFNGIGWIRFEPTPSIDGTGGTGSTPVWARADVTRSDNDRQSDLPGSASTPAPSRNQCAAQRQNRFECDQNQQQKAVERQGTGNGNGNGNGTSFPVIPVGLGVGVPVVLALPWLVRTTTRRRRLAAASDPESHIHGAWAELRDTVLDHGFGWDAAQTPRQVADRLIREATLTGTAADGLIRITRAAERLRYARTHGTTKNLFADVRAVRDGLVLATTRLGQWRAVLLPPSSAALLRLAGARVARVAQVAQVLDRVEGLRSRLRAAAFPRRRQTTPR